MKIRRIFRLTFIFVLFAFIGSVFFFLFTLKTSPKYMSPLYAISKVISFLPALFTAALLVGAAYNFENNPSKYERLHDFRRILYSTVFFTALVTFAFEIISPRVNGKINKINNLPHIVSSCIESAKILIERGQKTAAAAFLDEALKLDAKNESAKALLHSLPAREVEKETKAGNKNPFLSRPFDTSFLIKTARASYEKKNFIDAHHYSALALKNALPSKESEIELKEINKNSWKALMNTAKDEGINAEYAQKLKGYFAYSRGEYLEAYKIFYALARKSRVNEADTADYLQLSKEKLGERYFFDDEIVPLPAMNYTENVHFKLENEGGGFDVLHIERVANDLSTQNREYLLGLSLYSFDRNGGLKAAFYAEKAKLVPLKSDSERTPDKPSDSLLELCAVDKEGKLKKPLYKGGYEKNIEDYRILHIKMSDFLLLKKAVNGVKAMPIHSLFHFSRIAEKYGFSSEIAMQCLIKRTLSPAFFLAVFIFAAAIGSIYRLKKRIEFQLSWLIPIALIAIFVCAALPLLFYMYEMFLFALISLFGAKIALIIAVIAHVLLLFNASVYFMMQGDE